MKFIIVTIALATLLLSSACGVLLGNVRPVTEKSQDYDFLDLSSESKDWERLPPEAADPSAQYDLAFQSRSTAAIISLNSACREKYLTDQSTLREYTDLLLLGVVTDIADRKEDKIEVSGVPGLRTTLNGVINDEKVRLQTVVLKKGKCLYDFLYVALPEKFKEHKKVFAKFVNTLKLRE